MATDRDDSKTSGGQRQQWRERVRVRVALAGLACECGRPTLYESGWCGQCCERAVRALAGVRVEVVS